jgi:hypothetical protein
MDTANDQVTIALAKHTTPKLCVSKPQGIRRLALPSGMADPSRRQTAKDKSASCEVFVLIPVTPSALSLRTSALDTCPG